ncbi:Hypothetical protein BRZCDTV_498 [Brazilian cedratvirus IHUMI]|uniref:Uncharacterized protein n=1 Tax=Brazilian cedratvirus IHUMI TaxID=2126980 RepID=A0A2R8FFI5_9VIRU|nr:Hypothetical protein BRZCDTV_498 [Brazilian cedratvirus IHUMI]
MSASTEESHRETKEAVLSCYKRNHAQMFKDGWKIEDNFMCPPKEHQARNWAAFFYKTCCGVAVPNYICRFYP